MSVQDLKTKVEAHKLKSEEITANRGIVETILNDNTDIKTWEESLVFKNLKQDYDSASEIFNNLTDAEKKNNSELYSAPLKNNHTKAKKHITLSFSFAFSEAKDECDSYITTFTSKKNNLDLLVIELEKEESDRKIAEEWGDLNKSYEKATKYYSLMDSGSKAIFKNSHDNLENIVDNNKKRKDTHITNNFILKYNTYQQLANAMNDNSVDVYNKNLKELEIADDSTWQETWEEWKTMTSALADVKKAITVMSGAKQQEYNRDDSLINSLTSFNKNLENNINLIFLDKQNTEELIILNSGITNLNNRESLTNLQARVNGMLTAYKNARENVHTQANIANRTAVLQSFHTVLNNIQNKLV